MVTGQADGKQPKGRARRDKLFSTQENFLMLFTWPVIDRDGGWITTLNNQEYLRLEEEDCAININLSYR